MRRSRALTTAFGFAALAAAGAVVAQTPVAPPAPAQPAAPAQPPAAPTPEVPPADLSELLPAEPAPEVEPEPAKREPVSEAEPEPEVKVPLKRTRYGVAILQALDKVTAETIRFEAPVGQPIRYKSLVFTVRACELTAPDEPAPDAIAYLTIDSQPQARPGRPTPPPRQAFRGWMYAASPGLNPLEHPVYDAWLVSCRAAAPESGG
jgi:hypothetical protein